MSQNQPPIAICQDAHLILDENGQATLTASDIDAGSSDPDGDAVTLSLDKTAFTCSDIGDQIVTLTVTDTAGLSDSCTASVTVLDNTPPTTTQVGVNPNPVAVNTAFDIAAMITDNCSITATYTIDVGLAGNMMPDATIPTKYSANVAAGIPEPAVVDVCVEGQDSSGNTSSECLFLPIYDPEGGFVTGGGWIDSPAGAYTPDPTLFGKANFGFVSKYKRGTTIPIGQTEFHFQAADLNFHSDSYEWMVVTGRNFAQFKGVGTINGTGTYKFMLWAGDDNPDTFRIKIWEENESGEETVVYDNGVNQAIGGGSIVIHSK